MNGQNFAFVGYLELDSAERKKKIRHLESLSRKTGQSQIFMETPYRNQKLFDDLMSNCQPQTRLCIAREVSLASEFIKSMTIQEWKKNKPDLEKKPSIFIIDAR
jgi:16S rRNA (cytidine1402-2'-O)-methyltransferase